MKYQEIIQENMKLLEEKKKAEIDKINAAEGPARFMLEKQNVPQVIDDAINKLEGLNNQCKDIDEISNLNDDQILQMATEQTQVRYVNNPEAINDLAVQNFVKKIKNVPTENVTYINNFEQNIGDSIRINDIVRNLAASPEKVSIVIDAIAMNKVDFFTMIANHQRNIKEIETINNIMDMFQKEAGTKEASSTTTEISDKEQQLIDLASKKTNIFNKRKIEKEKESLSKEISEEKIQQEKENKQKSENEKNAKIDTLVALCQKEGLSEFDRSVFTQLYKEKDRIGLENALVGDTIPNYDVDLLFPLKVKASTNNSQIDQFNNNMPTYLNKDYINNAENITDMAFAIDFYQTKFKGFEDKKVGVVIDEEHDANKIVYNTIQQVKENSPELFQTVEKNIQM